MAVTTETRNAIWYTTQDSARWGRYYGILTDRYRRREVCIRSILMGSVMGAITTLIATMPPIAQALVGVVVGLTMIFDFVLHPSRTAAVLGLIRDECDQTRTALEELWRDLPTIEDGEARRRFDSLNRHLEHVTAKDPVTVDGALNESSARDAFKELEARYAN